MGAYSEPFFNVTISFVFAAIQLNPTYIRAILRRAELYEKTDKLDEALEDYKSILETDPSVHQAREACVVKQIFKNVCWPAVVLYVINPST